MEKSIRRLGSIMICCSLSAMLTCASALAQEQRGGGGPQTAANPAQAKATVKNLSIMPEKELFKKGEADFVAGRFLDAREALSLGLAKRKKVDKRYSPMLDKVNERLADDEAAKGEAACRQMDLVTCEKQIAAGQQFAATASVARLSEAFTRTVADLKAQLEAALKLSTSGDYVGSLLQLKSLTKYLTYLPTVNADIERTTRAYVQKVVADGIRSVDEKRWEDASQEFQRALELDKDNATAKAGLNTSQRARSGYEQHERAQTQLTAKNFSQALKLIDGAIVTYPEAPEFEQLKNTIIRSLVAELAAPLEEMVAASNDLTKTRDAYLRIDQIRQIDAGNPVIAKFLGPASENFGANALLKANELENIVDYSRIATAYVMKLNAKQRLPEGMVKQDDLKSIAAAFNRKRISQLLLLVENLSNASATAFGQTVQARARHTLDSLSLPDMRIRTLEEYQRTPNDDSQFQDLRPDGKSRNVQLSIGVSRYEAVREAGDPSNLRSKYINGIENIPNPDYRQKLEDLAQMRRALDKPTQKKNKPTPEGWTEVTYAQMKDELSRFDRTIQQDKILDYGYTKTEYKQRSTVELNITLRDYISREVLKLQPVRYSPPEKAATEIEGVRDSDVNGLQNQKLRLPTTEDDLRNAEKAALDEMDKKLIEILPSYTSRFFNEAEKAMKANDSERAVEMYLCHWAFFRGNLAEAQLTRVTDVVKKETGFDLKKESGVFLALLDAQ